MGDFFLLDLEARNAPIVLHFVNSPKPWQYDLWRGETRFARDYKGWFAASPWPDWPSRRPALARRRKPEKTPARRRFAQKLSEFLATRKFIDMN